MTTTTTTSELVPGYVDVTRLAVARCSSDLGAERPRAGVPARHARAAGVRGVRDRITDLRYEAGYELLHVLGKGAKPADVPLPIPVLRAVREAVDTRTTGPILRTRTGRRMDRAGASRAHPGRTRRWYHPPDQPHGLRRTFCTTGLVAGIGIRDMQYAMRHADPRTAMRYDMARANLGRHAAHASRPTWPG
jgi:integrase